MYLNARLLPTGERTPMKRTLFPKLTAGTKYAHDELVCKVSRQIPVTCTELDLEPNGPLSLLVAVISFCHQHEISLRIQTEEGDRNNNYTDTLRFNDCITCGARFSSAYHNRCPHCGGWGYSPYYEQLDKEYKQHIINEKE